MTQPKTKFVVSLAANYMTIDVMQATPAAGVHGAWKQWLAYLHRNDASNYRLVESITVQGNTGNPGLAVLFLKGLDVLRRNPHYVLTGTPLEVVLGPTLSRVGTLEMTSDGTAKLSDADKQAYVEAWIAQNWKMQATDCVVCSIPFGKAGGHLITCIERYIVDVIHSLCEHEGIQLRSCQPALATHVVGLINEAVRRPNSKTSAEPQGLCCTVFTERAIDGRRAPIVQFVVHGAVESLVITRMWLDKDGDGHGDAEVAGVIERLRAQHGNAAAPTVERIHWPHHPTEVVHT